MSEQDLFDTPSYRALPSSISGFPPMTLLSAARSWLRERISEGEHCPCCGQMAKIYLRSIHSTMARSLIIAYITHGQDWFHLATLTGKIGRGGEEGKLRYWGLLEDKAEIRDDGGHAGWWRVTPEGAGFVEGTIVVPKYAMIYDGRCLGLDTSSYVSIRDALGKRFNYNELMSLRV